MKGLKQENNHLVLQCNNLQISIDRLEKHLAQSNQEKKENFFENKRLKIVLKKLENEINNNSLQ